MSLFSVSAGSAEQAVTENAGTARSGTNNRVQTRRVAINPHLRAARRIAKKMRRLPDRSAAETQAGLAICAQLKAFLADGEPFSSESRPAPH